MVDGTLKSYRHFRKYTDPEIRDEQDEYFDNDATKQTAPGLFRDRDDITYYIKDSRLELLDMDELRLLKNSDVAEILKHDKKDIRLKAAIKLAKHYGKDYKSILNAFRNDHKLPPPLVIRDKQDNLYLMSGNTRIMLAAALGFNMPVKIVKYKKTLQTENFKLNKSKMIDVANWLVKQHKLRSKVKISRSTNMRGNYYWDTDTIVIDNNPSDMLDFVETILHEIDHAIVRKKLGANKYEVQYTKAGQEAVDKGKDFHDDNPFEIQAEKYAEKNGKKWLKKILHFLK
jgi:hypothetical protein|tara:strand:- start:10168 stop:11025 length:858 start_codon:yes stop_codon:yes gene_type:complete